MNTNSKFVVEVRFEQRKGRRVGPDFYKHEFFIVGQYDDLDKNWFKAEHNARGGLRKFSTPEAAQRAANKLNRAAAK